MTTTTVTLSYASDSYTLTVAMASNPVTVAVQAARDAYQLAVADGFSGTRAEWLASLVGEDAATATPVVLTLAAYLALSVPEQTDPTKWYVIPKAT